jgi:hypothetical protein
LALETRRSYFDRYFFGALSAIEPATVTMSYFLPRSTRQHRRARFAKEEWIRS